MADINVSAEHVIPATPDQVYACIADYEHHHRQFLPPAFSEYRVEEGGVGAGTRLSYRLKVAGTNRVYHARIDEPVPGRVIREMVQESSAVTTFTLEPVDRGTLTRIEMRMAPGSGLRGWVERRLTPRLFRPMFEDELQRLAAYLQTQEVTQHTGQPPR